MRQKKETITGIDKMPWSNGKPTTAFYNFYLLQNEIDEESESVRNMRILSSLTRLSRVHVVSLQPHDHDILDLGEFRNPNPEIFQPPPDYELAQEIRKKEEEELPSYSQAVSNSTINHM